MPKSGEETLTEALTRHVGTPDAQAFVFETLAGKTEVSRRQLADRAASVAAGLRAAGVGRGDRVVIAHPTSPEFLGAFWGCHVAGAAAVPLAPVHAGGEESVEGRRLAAVLERAKPAALLATADVVDMATRMFGPTPSWTAVEPEPSVRWGDIEPAAVTADDTAIIQFTSGSTGDPRGCVLTHAAVLAQTRGLPPQIGLSDPATTVSWAPLFHDLGLIGGVVFAAVNDALTVLQPTIEFGIDPPSWLRLLSAYRGTVSPVTNSGMALVVRRLRGGVPDVDLSSVEAIIIGAEPINPVVINEFVGLLAPCGLDPGAIHPAYGLAENVLMVTSERGGLRTSRWSRPDLVERGAAVSAAEGAEPAEVIETVSLGRPMADVEVRIQGEHETLGSHQIGEVQVRGPMVLTGYFEDPVATEAVFDDGWLRTGDLGFLGPDGELHLAGRAKDVIIVGGRNYHAFDLEHAAANADGVRPHAVVAFSVVEQAVEQAVVIIELRDGDAAAVAADVRRRCNRHVGLVPRVIVARPHSIPRTSSGKARRQEAKRLYQEGFFVDAAATDAAAAAQAGAQ